MNTPKTITTVICLSFAIGAQAQNTTIDLSKDPAKKSIAPAASTSNASLLQSNSTPPKPDSAMLNPKGAMDGTYNGRTMMQSSDNPQMMNSQSTQYKLGNSKATSTIYYDETGKVKGNSTSISVGGK